LADGDLCPQHYALHFLLDYHPASDQRFAASRAAEERGRAGAQKAQSVYALWHRAHRGTASLWNCGWTRGAGTYRHRSWDILPRKHGDNAHRRDRVPDVAWRTDHLARHRK